MLKRQAVLYLKRVLFVAYNEFHTKSSISTPKKTYFTWFEKKYVLDSNLILKMKKYNRGLKPQKEIY